MFSGLYVLGGMRPGGTCPFLLSCHPFADTNSRCTRGEQPVSLICRPV